MPDKAFDVATLPSVLRARLVEKNAAETFERYKGLVERNAITKDDFQKAELNLKRTAAIRSSGSLKPSKAWRPCGIGKLFWRPRRSGCGMPRS